MELPPLLGIRWGAAVSVHTGAAITPLPDNVIKCGLPGASVVTRKAPARVPDIVGVKVTEKVQVPVVGGKLVPEQLSVSAYSLSVVLTAEMAIGFGPLLVSVTVCAALVVFRVWLLKVSVMGEKDAKVLVVTV